MQLRSNNTYWKLYILYKSHIRITLFLVFSNLFTHLSLHLINSIYLHSYFFSQLARKDRHLCLQPVSQSSISEKSNSYFMHFYCIIILYFLTSKINNIRDQISFVSCTKVQEISYVAKYSYPKFKLLTSKKKFDHFLTDLFTFWFIISSHQSSIIITLF